METSLSLQDKCKKCGGYKFAPYNSNISATVRLCHCTKISDTEFTQKWFATENITVLPGSFLSREADGLNPGLNHVRIALVAPLDDCIAAAHRIKNFLNTLLITQ